MEEIIVKKFPFPAASWEAIEQYATDIGDRRVMAGLHYPSDNLCSWLITLRMANHVFRDPGVKSHLWSAIQRGYVYRLVRAEVTRNPRSPYAPAMAELRLEAAR